MLVLCFDGQRLGFFCLCVLTDDTHGLQAALAAPLSLFCPDRGNSAALFLCLIEAVCKENSIYSNCMQVTALLPSETNERAD